MRTLSLLSLVALLAACRPPSTVVVATVKGADGLDRPLGGVTLILLPYDRDSLAQALARRAGPPPDTMALARVIDSLREGSARLSAAAPKDRPRAQREFERLRDQLAPRLEELQSREHAWRDTAYGGWDTLTLALTHQLVRDPFPDTTDAQGVAVVSPRMTGPWWVTLTMWDAADPYGEWYWNVPLVGDTLRLSTANAEHRTRF